MKFTISRMLEEAYARLQAPNNRAFTRQAVSYLMTDREHYIELADPDTPEYQISLHLGRICHLVPLAIRLSKETGADSVCHKSEVLHLVVTENEAEYAIETSSRREYTNPKKEDTYRTPIYRRTALADLGEGFVALPPEQIAPVATKRRRDIFGMIFMAIAKFGKQLHIYSIPAKTERAMFYSCLAPDVTILVDGNAVTGKWVPLAREDSLYDTYREDHRYSWYRELGLMITPVSQFYVMKTHHIYRYFRKNVYDKDTPGACSYEDAGEKQEDTYQRVELDQIKGDLYPQYH